MPWIVPEFVMDVPLLFQKTIPWFELLPPEAEMVPVFVIRSIVAVLIDIIPREWVVPTADIVALFVMVLTEPPVFILIAPEFNAESVTLIVPPEELVISVTLVSSTCIAWP